MKAELRTAFQTRQYMLSKDFEIYYYADVHLRPVPLHEHSYYEFYLFLEGEDAAIEIGDKRLPLTYGTIALIPPGVQHRSITSPLSDVPYRRFVFWVSTSFAQSLVQRSADYGYLMQQAAVTKNYLFPVSVGRFSLVLSKAIRLLTELHENRYGRESAVALCVDDLILSMNRCVYEENHEETDDAKDLFQNLVLYIDGHLDEDLSLETLSERFYVSRSHIAHTFSDTIGIPLHQYVLKKRLEAARSSILSGTPVTKAFQSFGFTDYSAFYRAFRKEYGQGPKEYARLYSAQAGKDS